MEQQTEKMANKIIQWANINTGSFNVPGLERMAQVLAQDFSALECEGEVLSLLPIEQIDEMGRLVKKDLGPLLRFWKRKEAPVQILLVGHMDTVYGTEHRFQNAWRMDPEIICGPGVTDMKGGLCIMLEALKAFEKTAFTKHLGWEVIINPDEEIGSPGSGPHLVERAKFHHAGLLFEPSMDEIGTLAGERKGTGRFSLVVHGRAAHAGREFHKGRNAIVALSRMIEALHALNGQREGVSLNIGYCYGGGAVNVVPETAMCRFDVRIQKLEDEIWIRERLEAIVASNNEQEGYQVELKGNLHRKPKSLQGKTKELFELVQTVGQQIGQEITWSPSGGGSDGNNLAEAGLPNVDTLGVCGGNIHSEEEYLLVKSLLPRTILTTELLIKLSQGKF